MRRFSAMQALSGFGSTASGAGAGEAAPGSSSTGVRCEVRRDGAAIQADRVRRCARVVRQSLRASARFVLAAYAAGSVIAPARAEIYDGFLDPSFGDNGRRTVLFYSGVVASGRVVILQPDGKIVVMGNCSIGNQSADARVCAVRFLSNGTVDSAFGPNQNGPFLFSDFAGFPASSLTGAVRQSDGRFVLVGSSSDPAHPGYWVARLSASGQLERAPNGEAVRWLNLSARSTSSYSVVYAIAPAPGGKFVVAGSANSEADENNWDMAVARLNADLSLDQSFNPGGALAGVRVAAFDLGGSRIDRAYSVVVQPDGKIVAAGAANIALGPINAAAVLRLNADGTPDAGFGNDGRVWFTASPAGLETKTLAVALDARQNVLLVGNGVVLPGAGTNGFVARLRGADGTFDTSFGTDGTGLAIIYANGLGFSKYLADLLVQPDGKIVAVGGQTYTSSSSSFSMTDMERLLPNGDQDTTFSGVFTSFAGDALSPANVIWKATYDPRGYLVVTGVSNGDMGVARLTAESVFGGRGAGFE